MCLIIFGVQLLVQYLCVMFPHLMDTSMIGNTSGYFTGIALHKSRVKLLQSSVVNYPTTEQGRNLLMAQVGTLLSHTRKLKISSLSYLWPIYQCPYCCPGQHTVNDSSMSCTVECSVDSSKHVF